MACVLSQTKTIAVSFFHKESPSMTDASLNLPLDPPVLDRVRDHSRPDLLQMPMRSARLLGFVQKTVLSSLAGAETIVGIA